MIRKVVKKKIKKKPIITEENICFVISPIGKVGTKLHSKFKEVLDYVIKPAFEESGYKYNIIRADEIEKSGSFIKDILENIYSSYVVIADLTGQNPNVFYELGVRHALRPRTILIAQKMEDIPSDIRDYRTIIYDTSAKGAADFKKRIKKFLTEIQKEPERPDNPVLDKLGSIIENKLAQLEAEKISLKEELTKFLSGSKSTSTQLQIKTSLPNVKKRFERILELRNAEYQFGKGTFSRGDDDFYLPKEQGNFRLYFLKKENSILGFWYVSIRRGEIDIEDEMSDIRVLIEKCSQGQNVICDFIIVTDQEIEDIDSYYKYFEKMRKFVKIKQRKNFVLHLLDPDELTKWEQELGLKV